MTEQVLAEQRIGQNTEVTLHFALRLENGDTVDSTFDKAPATFKVGDTVSYRDPQFIGMPFVAVIHAVYEDHLELIDASEPQRILLATRESRPRGCKVWREGGPRRFWAGPG